MDSVNDNKKVDFLATILHQKIPLVESQPNPRKSLISRRDPTKLNATHDGLDPPTTL